MNIRKETFTEIALTFVERGVDYDKDEVIAQTAIEAVNQFHDAIGFGSMSIQAIEKMREAFKETAGIVINWTRLNRKAHPEEYADLMKGGAWPAQMVGGEL